MKSPKELKNTALAVLQRYKYPALIFALGLALLLWPSGRRSGGEQKTAAPEAEPLVVDYCAQTEQRLEKILSRIEGAGQVRVMLTLRSGEAVQYQTDFESSSQTEGEKSSQSSVQKTVILTKDGSYNEPAVVKTEYPRFQGALIVSQGGDIAAVRYQLSSAVASLLGLGTDQITVVKMK